MMKRFIAAAAVLVCVLSAAACGEKKGEKNESSGAVSESSTLQNGDISQDEATEYVNGTEKNTSSAEEKTEAVQSAVVPTSANGEQLHYPEGGAEFEEQLDTAVIAAAQELFEKACETEWNFTVGSPYSLDTSEYVTNEYGWQFYRITEEGINSLDDVRADFHRVFSETYDDILEEIFMEDGGHVYCLNGARGSDIFYEGSEVTEITGRSEGVINFKVISSYSGDGYEIEPYTEETEFSVVKGGDGAWRVDKFKLPY